METILGWYEGRTWQTRAVPWNCIFEVHRQIARRAQEEQVYALRAGAWEPVGLFGAVPWLPEVDYPQGAMVSVGAGVLSGSFYEALRPSRGVVPGTDGGTTWRLLAMS